MKLILTILQWFRREPEPDDAPSVEDQHEFWWAERQRCEDMTKKHLQAGDLHGAMLWWESHNACLHRVNRDVRMVIGMPPLQIKRLSEVLQ